jgi:phosphoenolpyruvate---glycerone phosphotransferase subunit DhaL
MAVVTTDIRNWLDALQRVYAENKQRLTELDSAIGDADHGINMERGFTALESEFATNAPADIRTALQTAATVLIRKVGGASGPLYGTFFLRAAASCGGLAELDAGAVVKMFRAGVAGVQQRGKAEPGDKTMLDALLPGADALRAALGEGASFASALGQAADAGEKGARDTIPLVARKGRASYLGERSAGHQDPGATSSALLLRCAAEVWA